MYGADNRGLAEIAEVIVVQVGNVCRYADIKDTIERSFSDTLGKSPPGAAILVEYHLNDTKKVEIGIPYAVVSLRNYESDEKKYGLKLGPYITDAHHKEPFDFIARQKIVRLEHIIGFRRIDL